MSFIPEEESPAETPGQIGLQRGNRFAIQRFKPLRAPGKTRKLPGIAALSDDETAVPRRSRKSIPPPGDTLAAEPGHEALAAQPAHGRLRALEFAPGGQHTSRIP